MVFKYQIRLYIASVLLIISCHVHTQVLPSISESEVSRIESTLSADEMQGRKIFTSGIEKAAGFIAREFSDARLKPMTGTKDFKQSFFMVNTEITEVHARIDGITVDSKNLIVLSTDSILTVTTENGYRKLFIKSKEEFRQTVLKYQKSKENLLILVDTVLSGNFARLASRRMPQFEGSGNRIFILTSADPRNYNIEIKQNIHKQKLTNLVGIIPGRSRPDEYVIFSAHYDHLGIGKPDAGGDSVYNGANDDASGTAAVIMLADYFRKLNNNQLTLVFVAFTAEEIGGIGSTYFSKTIDPAKVAAMINIEMIGTESKWGTNSAYITGFDKSDLGTILQKNLLNSPFKFYPDPYPEQQLFLRSDNASLATEGVPAHSISTSKMDSEKYYHTRGDEWGTLDLKNMTGIIQAIALSTGSIVTGKDSPTRVKF